MPLYTCGRCGYETNKMSNLKQHLQIDKVCKPHVRDVSREELIDNLSVKASDNLVCEGCERVFANKFCLQRHVMICKEVEIKRREEALTKRLQEQQDAFKNEVLELRSQLEASTSAHPPPAAAGPTTSVNGDHNNIANNIANHVHNDNSTTNNNNNTINININTYGNEDHSYITPEFIAHCVKDGAAGIVKYIDKLHFDKDHPENKNVKNLSKKQQLLLKYDGAGNWVKCDKNFVIDQMISKHNFKLANFALNNKTFFEEDNDHLLDRYLAPYVSLKPGNTNFYALRRQVYALILENEDGDTNVTIAVAAE